MDKTQNDLCANGVTLDYQAMLATSKTAYSHCVREINRHMTDLMSIKPSLLPYLRARWLAEEAEQLVIATETLYTLEQGVSRKVLKVVNKPPVLEL